MSRIDPSLGRELQAVASVAGDDHHPCDSISAGDIRAASLRPWACVYTQPQAERWAVSNLTRQGYQCFLPMMAVRRRDRVVRTLWHPVMVPLFSRYAFVRFDHRSASWSPINATPGVVGIVRQGHSVGYASEAAVSALQALEARGATEPPGSPRIGLGDAVRAVAGVFAGHPGVVTAVGRAGGDVLVAMLMFGELREIAMAVDSLEPREA